MNPDFKAYESLLSWIMNHQLIKNKHTEVPKTPYENILIKGKETHKTNILSQRMINLNVYG